MLKHGQRTRRHQHHAAHIREDAAADLRLIREAMDHSARFTDVPGVGMVVIGVTALVASTRGWLADSDPAWVAVWGVELGLAVTVGAVAIALKARKSGTDLLATPIRRFLRGMIPPLAAGAALAIFFAKSGVVEYLPGMLLLLYGTALLTGGAFSLKLVRVQGACFMALGAVTLFVRPEAGDAAMALGFGGLHIVFGAVIARRYGG
jgi:FtsH-binding integral membrane protein